ncbi:hypothetical protein TH53_23685 [Pedobacter lusitanus]|uniref:Contig127, whole genome shotgun sequence n=1 Tax=Pedobacter lusitanus TaxID=1503925 RepID=A0A0D0FR35_9SPHI|nr:radical SAM protein [Pedobacter lusitanus]KIO74889.1 hypothetical protein TH53_23685 [Pedobacter lusitanus]
MKYFKMSFYNVLTPVEEYKEYLLYNTLSGGIVLLNELQGKLIDSLQYKEKFDLEETGNKKLLKYLLDQGFVVDFNFNEIQKLYTSYKKGRDEDVEEANIYLTIATTITCNMGCPYCYEVVKPNISLNKDETVRGVISYLEDMIVKNSTKTWKKILVTWYGGEPLLNQGAIEKLTPPLLELAQKYSMDYDANIITNGILLNQAKWDFLKLYKVSNAQITIDGSKETHEKHRPLKGKSGKKNYFQILENLALMPDGITTNIRMNVDRAVSDSYEEFLTDLSVFGIWPQRSNSFSIDPAWLRTYEEAEENDLSDRFNAEEYFESMQTFRRLKLSIYNNYAAENGLKKAKLAWILPELQEECATWVSPYGIVIDPEGFIHKCWETVHEDHRRINHVKDGYRVEDFKEYMAFDRYKVNDECYSCKYLPVCDQLTCAFQALKHADNPPCTFWKTKTESSLKEQYLYMKENPDLISFPKNDITNNTGHSNK